MNKTNNRKHSIAALLLALIMVLSLVPTTAFAATDATNIKIGVVYVGDENEGYTASHMSGIYSAMDELGIPGSAIIEYTSVPEDETCYDRCVDLAESGCNVIFTNSYGHQTYCAQAAEEYPNVQFVAMTGDFAAISGLNNFSNAACNTYESRYVSGVVAGMKLQQLMSKGIITDPYVGYVASFPYAEVISGYTAFFLGIKSIVADAHMDVQYTQSWFDMTKEAEAANALMARGCVIIGQHSDSIGVPSAVEEALNEGRIAYSVGYNIDMQWVAPNAVLTSAQDNWGVYFKYALSQVMAGKKIASDWSKGYAEGANMISELGKSCAPGTAEKVAKVETDIKNGSLKVFDTSAFTVDGETLTSAPIDLSFGSWGADGFYEIYHGDTVEAIVNGAFAESTFRSAPYFALRIDGITELTAEDEPYDERSYGVWIGDELISEDNISDDGWSYDAESETLTLKNATIFGEQGIYSDHSLNINLVGTTTMAAYYMDADSLIGIEVWGDLSITGNGTLKFVNDGQALTTIINCYGNLSVENSALELTAYANEAIWASEFAYFDNCRIYADASSSGIVAASVYEENSNISITGATYKAITSFYGDVILNGGNITVRNSETSSYSSCIYAGGGMTIIQDAIINANVGKVNNYYDWDNDELISGTASAIFGEDGIEISGGTTTISCANGSSYNYGLISDDGDITITNGNVTITTGNGEAQSYPISSNNGDITIIGGNVNAKAGNGLWSYGIRCDQGDFYIKNATVVAVGTDGAFSQVPILTGYSNAVVKASQNKDGSGATTVSLTWNNIDIFKYVNIIPGVKMLANPSLPTLSNTVDGVALNWPAVSGAEQYRVYYKVGSGSWTKYADTTDTSMMVTGLTSGTKYSFTVRCLSADGKSFTSSYNNTGKSITYIAAPAVSSVANVANGVTVKWAKVTGAAQYRVFYKIADGGWTKFGDTTNLSMTVTGLTSNTEYSFTVRCLSTDGKSFTSGYDTTGMSITYFTAPTISSVSNAVDGVVVKWAAVSGAGQYRVYCKTGSGSWTKYADTTDTSMTVTGLTSNTKYSFTVRCLSEDGKSFTSSYDNTGKSITYLSAPVVSSVANSASGVTVKWDKVTGAAQYRVFYKTADSGWKKFGDTTGTSMTVTGLTSNTEYSFTVRCLSKDGKSFTSGYDTTGMSITYVAAPVISSVSNAVDGVVVKWAAVSGAGQYRVYCKTGSGSWTKYADTTDASMTVTGLTSGTKYSFTVRCLSEDGKSFTSSYDNTGKSITYLSAPAVSSVANSASGVTVKWAAVSGAEQYRVFYKTADSGWKKFGDTTGTSMTVTGLTSNTEYSFTVRCLSADGKSFTSGYDTTGISIMYIAAPVISSVSNATNGVTVKWAAVSGAGQYRVYYKTGSSSWTKYADTTDTSMTVTGLTSGTKYSFTVRCLSEDGKSFTSSYDNTGKSITYLSVPTLGSATTSSTGITVKWSKVTGASGYYVYRKTSSSGWSKIGTVSSNSTVSFKDANATKGTTYTYTVRAYTDSTMSSYNATGVSAKR